jgi:hypothetical protein
MGPKTGWIVVAMLWIVVEGFFWLVLFTMIGICAVLSC